MPIFENKITKKKDIILKKVGIISDKDLPKFDLISEIPKKKDIALPKISELNKYLAGVSPQLIQISELIS